MITDANPISIPTSKLLNAKGRAADDLTDKVTSLCFKFWPKDARGLSQTKNAQLRNVVYNLCNVAFVRTKRKKVFRVQKTGVSVEQIRDLVETAKAALKNTPSHPLSLLKKAGILDDVLLLPSEGIDDSYSVTDGPLKYLLQSLCSCYHLNSILSACSIQHLRKLLSQPEETCVVSNPSWMHLVKWSPLVADAILSCTSQFKDLDRIIR